MYTRIAADDKHGPAGYDAVVSTTLTSVELSDAHGSSFYTLREAIQLRAALDEAILELTQKGL